MFHLEYCDAEAKRVLSEFGWSHYIGRGVPRDRKAGEPEGMLQRSVQRHLESGRVVRVYGVMRKRRAEVPNIAVRLVRHQQAGRHRLPRPAKATGDEDLHRTAVRNKR